MRQPLCAASRRIIAVLAMSLVCAIGFARQPTPTECLEGGDFIRNAALARDNGMSEVDFISRIRDDIELIQAYPPQLRWFVHDDDDAAFLVGAATEVFRNPKAAALHQSDFVRACLKKSRREPGRET